MEGCLSILFYCLRVVVINARLLQNLVSVIQMEGSSSYSTFVETASLESTSGCIDFLVPGCNYRLWYAEKRKVDNQERTRRCHARKAEVQKEAEVNAVRSEIVDPRFLSALKKNSHRISAKLAGEIGLYAAQKMKDHDSEVHHLTVLKILGQPVLKDMVPPFLRDPTALQLGHSVLGSFKDGLQTHLVGLRKAKSVLAKNIVTTFAVALGIGSQRDVAGLLGVDRRNIKKALARRVLLDNTKDAFWLGDQRRVCSDGLPDVVKKNITKWWEEETTISPNRKDIVRKWIGPKLYIEHATHYLQLSQVRLDSHSLQFFLL